jgi:acyl-coenzyme A thioesterase PaaI-like protein
MARKLSPALMRRIFNLWPPFLGARIRVAKIAPDWREIVVEMPLRLTNRNYFGTHFGGSLYAMTDPFFALMVLHNLPYGYTVWDKAASIDFVAPGRGRMRATFTLSQTEIDAIVQMTASGDKHLHMFRVDVLDAEALVVARVEKVVYIRKRVAA